MKNPQHVNFTVEPDFIVKYARDQVMSKDWRGALRTLTTATNRPMTLDQAVSILKGEQTLATIGNDQVELVAQPEDCKSFKFYRETARWQQAGIFERDGEFYQPYAEITGFVREDAEHVLSNLREAEYYCSMKNFMEQRGNYYRDNQLDDIVCFDAGVNPVIMKRVQGPAFWVKTFTTANEAVIDYLAGSRNLESRGGSGKYAFKITDIEFYLEAVIEGLVYVNDMPVNMGTDADILATIGDMRETFEEDQARARRRSAGQVDDDDDQDDERRPWRSSESDFENIATSLVWRSRVERAAEKNGGFIELVAGKGDNQQTFRVARNPFTLWARQYGFKHGELPEWTRVCPSGLKMMGDNPMHTDWWVSSGLPLRAAYDHDHPLNKAAWKLASMWQDVEGSKCLKLAGSGKVTGPVAFPGPNQEVPAGSIAVVSHAGPEYQMALMSACKGKTGALVSAVGGKMAHLAVVSRELGMRIAVVDEALTKFKEGELVTIDFDTGDVQIHGRNSRYEDYAV